MNKPRFRFASFYCGAGFGSHGGKRAGGYEVFGLDIDPRALRLADMCHPETKHINLSVLDATVASLADRGIPPEMSYNLDLLITSPPCVGASKANLYRHPFHRANMLLLDTPRVIAEFKPKVVVVENVAALLDPDMAPLLADFLARCEALEDYTYEYRILNARDFNVPQIRKRFIMILVRKDVGIPLFPEPTTKDYEALNLNSILPGIIGYDLGGTRRKVKCKDTGELIGLKNKIMPANQTVGTVTKTKGLRLYDMMSSPMMRPPTRFELLRIGAAEDMDFSKATDDDLQFGLGNGLMPNVMEAIANTIAKAYFD